MAAAGIPEPSDDPAERRARTLAAAAEWARRQTAAIGDPDDYRGMQISPADRTAFEQAWRLLRRICESCGAGVGPEAPDSGDADERT
jgi:hypothetical protein